MDEPYLISVLADEPPAVQAVVDRCLELGFATTSDGHTDSFEEYVTRDPSGDRKYVEDASLEAAISAIEGSSFGKLSFWFDVEISAKLSVTFRHGTDHEWNEPTVSVSFQTMPLDPTVKTNPGAHSAERVRSRAESILELVGSLSAMADAQFGWGAILTGTDPIGGLQPSDRPIAEHVDRFGWITVLSPAVVEQFGGREYVLDAPAWRIDERETGHVVLAKADNPVSPVETPDGDLETYLLEGGSEDGGDEETVVHDPFAELPEGAHGTDVVVPRDRTDGELTNDDLELVRVTVEDDALWRLDDGAFHRRIFDDDGTFPRELPEGVDPEEEPYPPLIRLAMPVEFVQTEEPGEETVVSKVLGLDVDVDKLQLLTEFGATGAQGPESRAAVRDLIDNLLDIEDVDGVEDVIRQQVLRG